MASCSYCDRLCVASQLGVCVTHDTHTVCRLCAREHADRSQGCVWYTLREGAGLQGTAFYPYEETVP